MIPIVQRIEQQDHAQDDHGVLVTTLAPEGAVLSAASASVLLA
jgi:hypothetical protein